MEMTEIAVRDVEDQFNKANIMLILSMQCRRMRFPIRDSIFIVENVAVRIHLQTDRIDIQGLIIWRFMVISLRLRDLNWACVWPDSWDELTLIEHWCDDKRCLRSSRLARMNHHRKRGTSEINCSRFGNSLIRLADYGNGTQSDDGETELFLN
jgi:hypothetical protein